MTVEAGTISRRYRTYILILLAATYGLNMADRGILSVIMPVLKKDFHFHDWQIGVLAGPVFAVVYSLCSLPSSSIADRFSRKNLIAASMLIFSGATLTCGMAVTYWQLAVGRFLTGSAEAATVPAANSVIADLYPPERARRSDRGVHLRRQRRRDPGHHRRRLRRPQLRLARSLHRGGRAGRRPGGGDRPDRARTAPPGLPGSGGPARQRFDAHGDQALLGAEDLSAGCAWPRSS